MKNTQLLNVDSYRKCISNLLGHRIVCFLAMCMLISLGMKAESGERCSIPVIETSCGGQDVCPGVSVVTISGAEGELIAYTTDGSDPSPDVDKAMEGPVVLTVTSLMSEVLAIALCEGKEASEVSSMELYPIAVSRYANYSEMFVAKAKGCLAGPYLIYAVEPIKNGEGSWILLCEPNLRESVNCIVAELNGDFQTIYPDLKVGELIDYIEIAAYDEQSTPARGGMKRVTGFMLPSKSVSAPDIQPELLRLDGAPEYWEDYYRMPIVIENVQVVDGEAFDLVVSDKFANVSLDFNDEERYNLRGFVGTDIADKHAALRFFVLGYEKYEQPAESAGSINEAFDFDGESRAVVFCCDLKVVAVNRECTHLFVSDSDGSDMVLTGDFGYEKFLAGDIIRDFRANLSTIDGVRYGAVDGVSLKVVRNDMPGSAMDIPVAELTAYVGRHVQFESKIERVASRDIALPELRVGGVIVNSSAISDETAEKISQAVEKHDADDLFKLRGFVMPDGQGNMEFWPIEIVEVGGVSGISDFEIEEQLPIVNGRPVLSAGQEMRDLLGRKVDSASATAGVYIINMQSRTVKVVIR